MRSDTFTAYHPVVNFVYFASVLAFGMLFMHPVLQGIALASATVYSVMLNGRRAIRFQLFGMLPLLLVMATVNPLFNHAGATILFYLKSGNPVTLESIAYGIASSCMLVTVIVWFSCLNKVMTSDKLHYLFGSLMPALSLIFSMSLRFVPRYRNQLRVISMSQRCIGRDVTQGNVLQRARNGLRILSIMTTWAMENAIETADSMRARGYGLPRRTSFSVVRFDRRDLTALTVMAGLLIVISIGAGSGENTIRFFPTILMKEMSALSAAVYAAYSMLCMLPVLMRLAEELKWKYIVSRT